MITICLNGENRTLPAACTVAQLIADLGLGARRVAVVRNGEVVPREAQNSTLLVEGDCVDVIHMVGGG
ncbi:MAG: sulfur carrier protein ThiS [Candidatus Sumerlaeia bacterium]|nr:sulfur carrier protein ThiS [Candidatus Sumerlaeia bacterium]